MTKIGRFSRVVMPRAPRFSGAIAAVIVVCGTAMGSIGPAAAQPTASGQVAASYAPPFRYTNAARHALAVAAGSNDNFNSDSCTSSTFCMAVGDYELKGYWPGLSETFSGGNWVAESVPSPSRGVNVFANEVSCASPASCLFVGDHWAGQRGPSVNLAEAWNGSAWRVVAATGPAGTAFSYLDDVACPTTRFCLAIGSAGAGRHYQDTAYTWKNGTTWQRITVPRPSGARNSELGGLACFNSRNCMAVGNYTSAAGHDLAFAARWHNGRWNLLTTPAVRGQRYAQFQGISCPAATRCVAVGNTEDNTRGLYYHAFAEVWSGGAWHISTLRRPPSVFLGASCPAVNRCFATGYTFPSLTTFAHPLIETWNGHIWTTQNPVQTSAPYTGNVVMHVSCVTGSVCEAAGYRFEPKGSGNLQTLAEMWNGHRWTMQTTANP